MAVICPLCGEPVPWSRRLFRAALWDRWRCTGCGSLLKFGAGRRGILMTFGILLAMVLYHYGRSITSFTPIVVALPMIAVVLVCLLMVAIEQVSLLEPGPGYCRNCAYNLTGLTADRCPECGEMIREEDRLAIQASAPAKTTDKSQLEGTESNHVDLLPRL